jgi:putative PIN family toxin of toxin-antitoxin system
MRIVLDTNVIVSALVFGGSPRRVFELIEDGHYEFFYSPAIQAETSRVLGQKFGWDRASLDRFLPALWARGSKVVPQQEVEVVAEDPADNRILECALSAKADVIVSGDRHLTMLRSYGAIAIMTPRQFLEAHRRGEDRI